MRFPAALSLLLAAMSATQPKGMEAQQITPVLVPQTVAGNGTAANAGASGLATAASLSLPNGIVVDAVGNYYVSESTGEVVVKVSAGTGIMTIVAGNGTAGYAGDGGLATNAELNNPAGLAIDNNGNLLIADDNNDAVRKVDLTTGIITTFAGNGTTADSGNGGPATSAGVDQPYGLACDRNGNTYIVEVGGKSLRMVNASGIISTIAGDTHEGDGGNGGPATAATVYKPYGGWMDAYDNLFFSEPDSHYVREINPSGILNLVAGTGTAGRTGNGGPANVAELDAPRGVSGDNLGNLFIAESGDIREVNTSGIINMIAGTGTTGYAGDGGPVTAAEFSTAPYIALDSSNNIYVADGSNERVRRLSLNTGLPATSVGATAMQNLLVESSIAVTPQTAAITPGTPAEFTLGTLAGCALGSLLAASTPCTVPITFTPIAPGLQSAQLAFTDASGNVSPIGLTGVGVAPAISYGTATISTIAGNGTGGNTGAGGSATAAEVSAPRGGVIDSAGNIFFADSGNNVIRRIDASTGTITTVAGVGTAGYTGDGSAATAAELNAPAKVVVDSAGDLYIADTGNSVIRYVSAATGFISTIAGTGTAGYTGDNAAATSAELNHPQGLAVDLGGHVYVADTGNNVIRYFGPGWYITTLYGNGTAGFAGDGGTAYSNTVELNAPTAIAFDLNSNLYIADSGNDVIRVVTQPDNQMSTFAGQPGSRAMRRMPGMAVRPPRPR
jgi:sugar lactone lactonase YvrE